MPGQPEGVSGDFQGTSAEGVPGDMDLSGDASVSMGGAVGGGSPTTMPA